MIIQVTFKSGTQQFFEMDDEGYTAFADALSVFDPTEYLEFYTCDTGAAINLNEVAGAQHYITPEMASVNHGEDREIMYLAIISELRTLCGSAHLDAMADEICEEIDL